MVIHTASRIDGVIIVGLPHTSGVKGVEEFDEKSFIVGSIIAEVEQKRSAFDPGNITAVFCKDDTRIGFDLGVVRVALRENRQQIRPVQNQ